MIWNMATLVADRRKTEEALLDMTAQLAGVVRSVTDTAAPVPGWAWTVGEMASHLVTSARVLSDLATGATNFYAEGTREGLAAANAGKLKEFTERDGGRLADHLEEATRAFVAAAGNTKATLTPTPMGEMDAGTLCSYMLTHTLQHGYPLAKVLHRPLRIPEDYVALTLPFLTTAMFVVVQADRVKGLTASYLIHFRGGPRLAVSFDNGSLSVEALESGAKPSRRVDCHISANPVAFLLVALGLVGQWGPIATGRMTAWGIKPWLAFSFNNYFAAP
jgi:uncharacterized protein (TIGR03083 family)